MDGPEPKTALLASPLFENHSTGAGHPERPERTERIRLELDNAGLSARCRRIEPVEARMEDIGRVHDSEYVERLRLACENGDSFIDTPDSAICPESWRTALLAAGGVAAAADMIAAGEIKRAFCAVRPPGHHAERNRSMGFCLLNNIAIAAARLQQVHGVKRLAILDWDVHHGNGTQQAFESDPDLLFVSLHQDPRTLYPGSGFETERGVGPGEGTVLNITLAPGTDGKKYLELFESKALATIKKFEPEMLLISAGFDLHEADPLAGLKLDTKSCQMLSELALGLAAEICGAKVLTVLEGGYNLDVLAACCTHHVGAMLKLEPED